MEVRGKLRRGGDDDVADPLRSIERRRQVVEVHRRRTRDDDFVRSRSDQRRDPGPQALAIAHPGWIRLEPRSGPQMLPLLDGPMECRLAIA